MDPTKRLQTFLGNIDASTIYKVTNDDYEFMIVSLEGIFRDIAKGSYLRFISSQNLYVYNKNTDGMWSKIVARGKSVKTIANTDDNSMAYDIIELIKHLNIASIKVSKDDLSSVLDSKVEYMGITDFENTVWESFDSSMRIEIKCPARGGYYLSINTSGGESYDRTFTHVVLLVKYLKSIKASYMGRVL